LSTSNPLPDSARPTLRTCACYVRLITSLAREKLLRGHAPGGQDRRSQSPRSPSLEQGDVEPDGTIQAASSLAQRPRRGDRNALQSPVPTRVDHFCSSGAGTGAVRARLQLSHCIAKLRARKSCRIISGVLAINPLRERSSPSPRIVLRQRPSRRARDSRGTEPTERCVAGSRAPPKLSSRGAASGPRPRDFGRDRRPVGCGRSTARHRG